MFVSVVAVVALFWVAYHGVTVSGLQLLFGVAVPYLAVAVFAYGLTRRVLDWASSPVPFRIPSTCGQQKSLDWIRASPIENPSTTAGAVARMALEVLAFRSLLRNTTAEVRDGKVVQGSSEWLWLGALAFHWCLLVVLLRHLRLFSQPVPFFSSLLGELDGFFQLGLPSLLPSGLLLVAAATFLLGRRAASPRLRYLSLPADYFPLLLILVLGVTGLVLRHHVRVDVIGVKALAGGLVSLHPVCTAALAKLPWLFFVHLFFASVLLAYLPFSKLVHMAGIFLSPTRNLANTNRMERHVNPWDYPVKVHTYSEYEDEFRQKMVEAGIPVEKE